MGFADLLAATDRVVLAQLQGDPVTYTPLWGEAVVVPGVFSAAHHIVDVGTAGVVSSIPAVFVRLSDLPSDPDAEEGGPTVSVAGKNYSVREVQRDGEGGAMLLLTEKDD